MVFYIVVTAKNNEGRILDETVLEFTGYAHPKRIEQEIKNTQHSMSNYLNRKNLIFTQRYARSEQEATRSKYWALEGKGGFKRVES